ncbi:hypothetical protein EIP86_003763 [Pleurotus ostreatoroseus]|nr:hypothetical protein EIP86_003763 [Pleurotus ostreatoroseus]
MIVLHPNSVCDVCFDNYSEHNVPHSIRCGHVFCLSFSEQDVRRLLVDKTSQPGSPIHFDVKDEFADLDADSSAAVSLRNRITRIVLDGGKATDVRDLLDEVRNWLGERTPAQHADLRAAYLLLFKYTDLQYKVKEEKAVIAELKQENEELTEQIRVERERADAKYQELSKKRMDEMETAMNVERNLRDRVDQVEQDWKQQIIFAQFPSYIILTKYYQYNACLDDCRRLKDELKRGKQNPLPTPPRAMDAPFFYSVDRDLPVAEPMDGDEVVVSRPGTAERSREREDRFELSPIPATASLPATDLPNRQNFRPLTAEESDVEDFKSKRISPYLIRSIDPIPIRPSLQRMGSSSSVSVSGRSGYDCGIPRSLPRSSVDVHMASCSSSPKSTFQYSPKDRDEPMSSVYDSSHGLARRATVSSYAREREDQQERVRKLSDVLDRPLHNTDMPPPLPKTFDKQQSPSSSVSPGSSVPATRNSSPVSPLLHSPLLHRPAAQCQSQSQAQEPISRASVAALQAERARAMSLNKDTVPLATPVAASPVSPSGTALKDRETPLYPAASAHYQPRRPSMGSIRGKSAASVPVQSASGLTRSLWSMPHEAAVQRV